MVDTKFFKRNFRYLLNSAANGWKILKGDRFIPHYQAPYRIEETFDFVKLRHYCGPDGVNGESSTVESSAKSRATVLLIPPLMVTAQIYDISPPLSAVNFLRERNVDVWLADLGIPEREQGGFRRSISDYIENLDKAIDYIVEKTSRSVHVMGYSQGGIFAYLVAAYRTNRGIASLVTFGSPIDLQKNFPPLAQDLIGRFLSLLRETVGRPLEKLPALPGNLNSLAFKLVNPRKELKYLREMLKALGDVEKLQKLEPARRFLAGEGFTAWPGPALRQFIDDLVLENRMLTGGLVISGRTISLSELEIPILSFVGVWDDIARSDSVRAIVKSAHRAQVYECPVQSGHFGLVVGSKAISQVWPTVVQWLDFIDKDSYLKPENIRKLKPSGELPSLSGDLTLRNQSPLAEFWQELLAELNEFGSELATAYDWLRWQLPRAFYLAEMSLGKNIDISTILKYQARKRPNKIFFFWQGVGYTYRQVDRYVSRLADVLYRLGIRPGEHVGIFMDNHPDYLASLAALNRIRAVGVLINPNLRGELLKQALNTGSVQGIIADPQHIEPILEVAPELPIFSLRERKKLADNHFLLESYIDYSLQELPSHLDENPGTPDDTAFFIYTSGTTGKPKAAKISNRRWLLGAIAGAVFGKLTPSDTVYCCLPLYHASGVILASGGALISGARLALAPKFSKRNFWRDVRKTGSTVVFYIGEMCRYLLSNPPSPFDKNHSVRLFIGNGLRPDVWRQLLYRFGPLQIVEFYAATEGNTFIVNLTGEKIGSIGRVPFGISTVELAKYDLENDQFIRDKRGFLIPADEGEPGMLLVKISKFNPTSIFDGYSELSETEKKIVKNAFRKGDAWFVTGDLLKRDSDGDFWFVDRLGDTFRWKGENISTDQVTEIISRAPFVEMVAVYGVKLPEREGRVGMAAIQLREKHHFDPSLLYRLVSENLFPPARPQFVRLVEKLELTNTFKVKKYNLQREGADPSYISDPLFWYDSETQNYSPLTRENYLSVLKKL